jgi:transposase, IS5 family
MRAMKQADLGLNLTTKRTRKREFLAQMERVVPWVALVELVAPYAPEGKKGRPPFPVETMLRVHFMQQWFTLSDPAMEEALHDVPLFREFAGLGWGSRLPKKSTILRFRHLLEKHKLADQILAVVNDLLRDKGLLLKTGTVVDATLISAPSSTKNASAERDPEMHQTKKGNQWYFGMKAHIGVDAESGLVHTVRGTAANVNDVVEANSLLHGQETDVFADAGYQGAAKRPDAKPAVNWHVAMRPGKRRALDKNKVVDSLIDQVERLKASVRAKVEYPFRVIKRQFGHVKVRYRGLKKNTAQLTTMFALSNLWMARKKLLVLDGQLRSKAPNAARRMPECNSSGLEWSPGNVPDARIRLLQHDHAGTRTGCDFFRPSLSPIAVFGLI